MSRTRLTILVGMLALMVAYTFLGLWALSLPLGVPQLVPTAG